MAIQAALAAEAVERLSGRLDLSAGETAAGIVTLVNNNMANAIRSRTIQKGHDPRGFTLVAFGGAGPLHAAEVARSLEIPQVLVPIYPGLTSAMGLLSTDLKYDLIENEFMLDRDADLDKLNADFARLDAEAREHLRRDGVPDESVTLVHAADCRYVGQGYELRVPIPAGSLNEEAMQALSEEFHRLHEEEYGHVFPSNPIQIVNIRVVAIGETPKLPALPPPGATVGADAKIDEAPVQFAENGTLNERPTAFYRREGLPVGERVDGPAVLVQFDSTIVVPPGASAEVLPTGDVLIDA
jgi:N-methylhydantoinase A